MSRRNLIIFICFAIMAFGTVVAASVVWMRGGPFGPAGTVTTTGTALVGGPFTLTAHTGERVTPESFRGRYMLIYFGYTYCPDVCPGALQIVSVALDALGEKAEQVQPIFITVDPQRDTVEQMAQYVPYFSDRLIGLTGSEEEIAEAAHAYRVYYARAEDDSSTEYLMDHTSILYLMDPEGNFVAHFPYGTDPDALTKELQKHLG